MLSWLPVCSSGRSSCEHFPTAETLAPLEPVRPRWVGLESHDGIALKHLKWPLRLFSVNKSPCAFRLARRRVRSAVAAEEGLCSAAGALGRVCCRCLSANLRGWGFSVSPCLAELRHPQNPKNHADKSEGQWLRAVFQIQWLLMALINY